MHQGASDKEPDRSTDVRICMEYLVFPEAYLTRLVPEIQSRSRKDQAQSSSERAPHYRGFEDTASVLCHESMDAGRKYHKVHPDEPNCQSSDAGLCPSA